MNFPFSNSTTSATPKLALEVFRDKLMGEVKDENGVITAICGIYTSTQTFLLTAGRSQD